MNSMKRRVAALALLAAWLLSAAAMAADVTPPDGTAAKPETAAPAETGQDGQETEETGK